MYSEGQNEVGQSIWKISPLLGILKQLQLFVRPISSKLVNLSRLNMTPYQPLPFLMKTTLKQLSQAGSVSATWTPVPLLSLQHRAGVGTLSVGKDDAKKIYDITNCDLGNFL